MTAISFQTNSLIVPSNIGAVELARTLKNWLNDLSITTFYSLEKTVDGYTVVYA